MDDLAAFLRARLDEDEAAARAATVGPWEWEHVDKDPAEWGDDGPNLVSTGVTWMDSGGGGPHPTQVLGAWGHDAWGISAEDADRAHIARHDPARVLREVEAKRAILARHMEVQSWSWPPGDGDEEVQQELGATVRILAAVYSGHPDYRAEWKP